MIHWKSIALVAVGLNVGVVYATACGDAGKAIASDSTSSDAYARSAFYMTFGPSAEDCVGDGPTVTGDCSCPSGFSEAGIGKPGESLALICLQD